MGEAKYSLELVKIGDRCYPLKVCTDGEDTSVVYGGEKMTLAAALAEIHSGMLRLESGKGSTATDAEISELLDEIFGSRE